MTDVFQRTGGLINNDPPEISEFSRKVSELLERTEYRRCDKGEDLEDIFRLRYKSYRMSDMVPENAVHVIEDDLDDVPNCYKFGIYIEGHLVSTLRLHHVTARHPYSASMMLYRDILQPMLAAGETFIDPSRLAADPEWSRVYPQIPYLTLRLAGMACFYFNAPYCISTIKDEHAGFYKQIFRSEQIGEARKYPGLHSTGLLYRATVAAIRERSFTRYPFFKSTHMEQRMLFGEVETGELAPLTVLPTAKYIREIA